MDIVEFNRSAWGRQVEKGNPWTVPVTSEVVAGAREGRWSVVLTPALPVPRAWFGELAGARVLALASAGGQQACVPDVRPVWRECARVLRPGGCLLAGFCQPVLFLFDYDAMQRGELVAAHRVPYSDLEARDAAHIERMRADGEPLEWGHTLDDQLGGMLDAGFALRGLYEDGWPGHLLAERIKPFMAVLAVNA